MSTLERLPALTDESPDATRYLHRSYEAALGRVVDGENVPYVQNKDLLLKWVVDSEYGTVVLGSIRPSEGQSASEPYFNSHPVLVTPEGLEAWREHLRAKGTEEASQALAELDEAIEQLPGFMPETLEA